MILFLIYFNLTKSIQTFNNLNINDIIANQMRFQKYFRKKNLKIFKKEDYDIYFYELFSELENDFARKLRLLYDD